MTRFEFRGSLFEIAGLPPVRAALRKQAEITARRAEEIAARERYEVNPRIEEGTRPKGRPYARIISYHADQEFGTWGKKRLRILGRAADAKE